MLPIRIACVEYLNTAALVEGLSKLDCLTLIPSVPARIAGMVRDGSADIGLCSIVDAVDAAAPLALLPAGMIGCDGLTHTVRIFSSTPLDRVRVLHADTESHTSVVLCRVVLKKKFGVEASVVDFDAREGVEVGAGAPARGGQAPRARSDEPRAGAGAPETLLLIGDKVVTCAPEHALYPHELDLGGAWKELTGLPFVYAAWMCRGAEAGDERIALGALLLDRQRRRNALRLDWIAEVRGPEHRWPADLARTYLRGHLRYEVGDRERQAAERFLSEAAAMGLIERTEITWVETGVERAVSPDHEVAS